jgi:hypothetical protein
VTFEENRAFSADAFQIVEPLSQHYVGVVLDYWQIFEGPGSTLPGPFLRKYKMQGIDTAGQVVLTPQGELLSAHRSWKSGNGLKRQELLDWATEHGGPLAQREQWRLSWLLIAERYFQQDLGRNAPAAFCSADGALHHARKMRRPLVRVEGAALTQLEQHSVFLQRHARQFWWQEGQVDGPSRLVVLNASEVDAEGEPSELTGRCSNNRVPTVMATIDLADVDLTDPERMDQLSAQLDECWRAYMGDRPTNAENLTFARDNIGRFKDIDSEIRRLARDRQLLAPGGRALFSR